MNDTSPIPFRHVVDSKADAIAAVSAGNPDDLLTTEQMAAWFHYSKQWFEIGRCKGYGPPFIKISWRVVYRRDAVLKWLDERLCQSTADYASPSQRRPGNGPKKKAIPETPKVRRLSDPV